MLRILLCARVCMQLDTAVMQCDNAASARVVPHEECTPNAVTGDHVPPRMHLYLCALPLVIACSLTVLDHGSVNLWFLRGSDNVWKLWAPASSSRGTG